MGLFRRVDGEAPEVDLTAYVGHSGLRLRWRYADASRDALDWYLELDDVALVCDPPPLCGPGVRERDRVADGGFEQGSPSPAWEEASTHFASPICTAVTCGGPGALTGEAWALFGGAEGAPEEASLEQTVVLHPGAAVLSFFLWTPLASGNGEDRFRLLVDGGEIWSVTEDDARYAAGYRRVELDLAAFADGGAHLLRLAAATTGTPGASSFFVDDVELAGCPDVTAVPEVAVADAAAVEGDAETTELLFTVELSHAWTEDVTVSFATSDGTARAGADYLAATGTVAFAPGETSREIAIDVVGDRLDEADESFSVVLTDPAFAVLADGEGAGAIDDDDVLEISVADAALTEADADLEFRITLSLASPDAVTVDYATVDVTASAGEDYRATAGTAVFAPGTTEQIVPVAVIDDLAAEDDESFLLELGDSSTGRPGKALGVGTILTDHEVDVDLALRLDDRQETAEPADLLTYVLAVENRGHQEAVGVTLTDSLPAYAAFVEASDGGVESGGEVTWPPFAVAGHRQVTRTLTVRVAEDLPPELPALANHASVADDGRFGPDPTPEDNAASDVDLVRAVPDLEVVTVDGGALVSDPATLAVTGELRFVIANRGSAPVSSPFTITVFEDADGDGRWSPGADQVFAAPVRDALGAGESAALSVPISGALRFRGNVLYVLADSGGAVAERDESNNLRHSGEACAFAPPGGAIEGVVELAWPPAEPVFEPDSLDVLSTPLVVPLTDDNGDGVADERDVPALVFVTFRKDRPAVPSVLRAIRGDTGAVIFETPEPTADGIGVVKLCDPAAADFDGDGHVEIVTCGYVRGALGNHLVAFEHDGTLKWVSEPYHTHVRPDRQSDRDQPAIADLDGDGAPEVIVGAHVFNGDGTLRWAGAEGQGFQSSRNLDGSPGGASSIAVDLDLDGFLEVVTGRTAYRHDGSVTWSLAAGDGYPAVGNFDDDLYPELVVVAGGALRLHARDGRLIWGPRALPGFSAAGGPPAVADVDGDGELEIGVAGASRYAVFAADGALEWTAAISDFSSSQTASTVFDLEGDGLPEVIYRDEGALRIFRGGDGAELFSFPLSSSTHSESAIVADVDGDGNAEIVAVSDRGPFPKTAGVRVFGDAGDHWASARRIWNQASYHVDNVAGDGAVPLFETWGWLEHGSFRANRSSGQGAFAAPNVTASLLRIDAARFPFVELTVRVGNGGGQVIAAGLPVAFYAGDPSAPAGVATTPARLEPGHFEDVMLVWEAPRSGSHQIHVRADDDAAGRRTANECDESDNEVSGSFTVEVPVDLAVTIDDGRDELLPGAEVTYTLTVTNLGLETATGVELRDLLPAALTLRRASGGGGAEASGVAWPPFELAAGATATRTVTVAAKVGISSLDAITNTATVGYDESRGPDLATLNNTATDVDAGTASPGSEYLTFWRKDLRLFAWRDRTRITLIDVATGEPLAMDDPRINTANFSTNPFVLERAGDSFEGVALTPMQLKVVSSDAEGRSEHRPINVWTGHLALDLRHPAQPPAGNPWTSYVPALGGGARTHGRELGREFLGFTSREMYLFVRPGTAPTEVLVEDLATNADADGDDTTRLAPADAAYADGEIEIYVLDGFEDDTVRVRGNADMSVLVGLGAREQSDWTATPPSYAAGDGGSELGTLFYTLAARSLTVFPLEDDTSVTITDLSDGDDSVTVLLASGDLAGPYELYTPVLSTVSGGDVLGRSEPLAVRVLSNGDPFDHDFVKVESDKPILVYVGPAGSDVQEFADVAYSIPTGPESRLLYAYAQNGGADDLQIFAFDEETVVTITSLTRTRRFLDRRHHDFVIGPGAHEGGWQLGSPGAGFWWGADVWSGELLRVESNRPVVVLNGDYDKANFGAFIPFVLGTPALPPLADAGPDQLAEAGDAVLFDGGGSFDQDAIDGGRAPRYEWDFDLASDADGDGDPANDADAAGATPTHVFPAPGVYEVTLTFIDDEGEADTDVMVVTVEGDPVVAEVSIHDAAVTEDAGQAAFEVSLAAPATGQVIVAYRTSETSGSARAATPGVDYESTAGVLTFSPGETLRTVEVAVLHDLLDERDESFTVELTALEAAVIVDGVAEATIEDDDEALISIDDVEVEEDAGVAVFTVTLATLADREIRVDYATLAETAVAGRDFSHVEGTIRFPALTGERALSVPILDDAVLEDLDESFRVELANAVETTISDAAGLGTIVDDEACPGPNLLVNPSAELRPEDGEVPGWTRQVGDWQRALAPPDPVDGQATFFAGTMERSELYQDVDVRPYGERISDATQLFAFDGYVRTFDEVPPDVVRLIVEYRDVANAVVLDAFDSGEIASPFDWTRLTDVRPAPAGTGWLRFRLVASRFAGDASDAFVDALELRSLRAPTVTIEGVTLYEGDAGTSDALFSVRLACAYEADVSVAFTTADGTALQVEDYLPASDIVALPSPTTARTIPVAVVGDAVDEPRESFFVELSGLASSGRAVLLDPRGEAEILNDDFCARSHGYWKNHVELWPVDWIVMGGVEYDAAQMLAFLNAKGGDATLHLALQLVATKLNLARGSDPAIVPTVEAADAFLELHPPGSDPRGDARREAGRLKDRLDEYNNSCADGGHEDSGSS